MFRNEQQISGIGEQVVVALHTWVWQKPILQPQGEIPEFLQRICVAVRAPCVQDHAILNLEGCARRGVATSFRAGPAIGPDDESPTSKVLSIEEPLEADR